MKIISSLTNVWNSFWGSGHPEMSPSWTGSTGTPVSNTKPLNPLGVSALYRSISLYADIVCAVDLRLLKLEPDGSRKPVPLDSNAIAKKLALWSFADKEPSLFDLLLYGNGYWIKETLQPIACWRVQLELEDTGELFYRVQPDPNVGEEEHLYSADEVLHLKYRSHGKHKLMGVSPLSAANDSMQLIHYIQESGRTIYKNIAVPGSVLETDMELDANQSDALRKRYDQKSAGLNKGGSVILSHNLKLKTNNLNNALDMQIEQLMKTTTLEASRIYGVPESLLSENSNVNRSNGIELLRSFYLLSLSPFAARFNDSVSRQLLTDEEYLSGYRCELDLSKQLIGHGEDRSNYLSKMVNSGIMSLNEVRNINDLEDIEGGNEFRIPTNTVTLTNWENFLAESPGSDAAEANDKKILLEAVFTPETDINKKSLFESIYK